MIQSDTVVKNICVPEHEEEEEDDITGEYA